jgi:hypothetical protein
MLHSRAYQIRTGDFCSQSAMPSPLGECPIGYSQYSIVKNWIFKAEILELLDFQRKSMYYNLT